MGNSKPTKGLSRLPPSQIQQASAGTGKTYALSSRYLQLLLAGTDPATILATTFTRSAAGEILDRIVKRLADAAADPAACSELSGQLAAQLTQDQAVAQLAALMRQINQLQVGTIDSFFYRLARASSFELGLPANWELADDDLMAMARDRAVQRVLADGQTASLLNLISHTEADRKISTALDRVIEGHYELFQQAPASAWELDAGGALRRASEQEIRALAERMAELEIGDKRMAKSVADDQSLLAQGELLELAGRSLVCRAAQEDFTYYKKPWPAGVEQVYRELLGLCRAELLAFNIERNRSMHRLLELYAGHFRELQREQGTLGFADVTRMLEALAQTGGTRLLNRLDGAVDHLLLDEFQDTSSQQWSVLAPFSRVAVGAGNTGSLFCVGDTKQAIYGWRGGVSEMFDVVRQEFGPAIGEAPPLIASRRSAPAVIETVNQVFMGLAAVNTRSNVERTTIDAWSAGFSRHDTVHRTMTGTARLVQAEVSGGPGDKVSSEENRKAVDAATVDAVQRITDSTAINVGVLVRANADAARLILELRRRGIPCSEEGGNPLTDSVAVNVILAAMQLADHPADSVSAFLVSHSPVGELLGIAPHFSPNDPAFAPACHRGGKGLRQRLQDEGYGATCLWLARTLFDQGTERERLRMEMLVNQATEFDLQGSLRPGEFVRRMEALRITDPTSARVRVMTIHRSKGLEFEAVIAPLYGTKSGWCPQSPETVCSRDPNTRHINRIVRYVPSELRPMLPPDLQDVFEAYESGKIRESLCLLYVMLTRAVRDLTVIVGPGATPDKSSPEGVLLATLGATGTGQASGVVHQTGDPEWFRKPAADRPSVPSRNRTSDDAGFYLPDQEPAGLTALVREPRSKRGSTWQRPSGHDSYKPRTGSQLLGLARLDRATRPDGDSALTGRQRGIVLHRLYQDLEWIDTKTRLPDKIPDNQFLAASDPSGQPAILVAEFKRQIALPQTAALLNRTSYLNHVRTEFLKPDHTLLEALEVRVKNEFPLVASLGTEMVEGFVDRLVLIYEGSRLIAAEIVDYKTDEIPAEAASKLAQHYGDQLWRYRDGLAVQLGLERTSIHGRIAFVFPGVVIDCRFQGGSEPIAG